MRVLVTDGNSRSALAITRSLGAAQHELHVSHHKNRSLAGSSKYCLQHHLITDPTIDRHAFIDEIVAIAEEWRIDLIIPPTDVSLLPISEYRNRLPQTCKLPLPSHEAIVKAADKGFVSALAEKLGVPVPVSTTIDRKDRDNIPEMDYPVVIKPARSRVQSGDGWLFTGVDYAVDEDELSIKLDALPDLVYPVLLQERVSGPGIGVFYCFDNGQRVARFAHKRLHEKPPSGGVSVLRESVEPHPKADLYGHALLKALNWHGVAMVEFKLDEKDNSPKLMEINGRFWGSLQLAIDSGVDFPDLLVRIAAKEPVQPVEDYKLGVRSRWMCGELDLLLLFLLKSKRSLHLPSGHPSRLLSALKVINPFIRNQRLEVLRLADIKPWFHEMREWLRG